MIDLIVIYTAECKCVHPSHVKCYRWQKYIYIIFFLNIIKKNSWVYPAIRQNIRQNEYKYSLRKSFHRGSIWQLLYNWQRLHQADLSIHSLWFIIYTAYLLRVARKLEPISAYFRWKAGLWVLCWQVMAQDRDKQLFTFKCITMANLK